MTRGDGVRHRTGLQPRRLAAEARALHLQLQAGVGAVGVEDPQRQGVQSGEEGHVGPLAPRLAQAERAVRGELGQPAVRQGPDAVLLLRLRPDGRGRRAGLLGRRRGWCPLVADRGFRLGLHRPFILRPHEPALHLQVAAAVDGDEHARERHVGRVEADRTIVQRIHRRLDLAHAPVLLLRQLLCLGRGRLDGLGFLGQRRERRLLPHRQRHGLAAELAQAVGVAVWEVGRDLRPLPALGFKDGGGRLQPVGHHGVDQRHVLQPATVVALEEVVQHHPAGLGIGLQADELRPLVRRAHRALRQHAPDGVRLLVVGHLQPLEHLLLALVVAVDGEGHQLVQRHGVLRIDLQQRRRDRGQPQALAHHGDRDEEGRGDLLLGLALLAKGQEGAELVQRMQGRALDVFRQAVFLSDPLGSDDTRDRRIAGQALGLDQPLQRPEPAAAGRDLIKTGLLALGVHHGADRQALQQGAAGDVLGELLDGDAGLDAPDVGLGEHQLVEGDVARGRQGDLGMSLGHGGSLRDGPAGSLSPSLVNRHEACGPPLPRRSGGPQNRGA